MSNGSKEAATKITAGPDLGNNYGHLSPIDTENGEVVEKGRLRRTTPEAKRRRFDPEQPSHIAIEVGTHWPWVSRMLGEERGRHELLVTDPRELGPLFYGQGRKTDKLDAEEKLARLARGSIPQATPPRRASRRECPGSLGAHPLARGTAPLSRSAHRPRSWNGQVLRKTPEYSIRRVLQEKGAEQIPRDLRPALEPLLETLSSSRARVRLYDGELEGLAQEHYPETKLLRQAQRE